MLPNFKVISWEKRQFFSDNDQFRQFLETFVVFRSSCNQNRWQQRLRLTVTDVSTEQVVSTKSIKLESEINVFPILTSAIRHRHGKNLFGAFRRVTPFLLWNMWNIPNKQVNMMIWRQLHQKIYTYVLILCVIFFQRWTHFYKIYRLNW